jgi:hypothetical protein
MLTQPKGSNGHIAKDGATLLLHRAAADRVAPASAIRPLLPFMLLLSVFFVAQIAVLVADEGSCQLPMQMQMLCLLHLC